MPRKPRTPSYRLHKPSGQAVVTLDGKDHYLGPFGSPESETEYRRLIGLWAAGGGRLPPEPSADLTVCELLAAYLEHARLYYRQPDPDTGEPISTPQQYRIKKAIHFARELYGPRPAGEFGPLALQAVRSSMVQAGYARKTVNGLVACLVRAFKWAAANELVPGQSFVSLRSVEGLKAGRCPARETDPVLPVPEEDIPPVLKVVLPVVADLIQIQLLTAARPGELVRLRPVELDRSGPVWLYRPRTHKTAYRGHDKIILFGPQAQAILARYLLRAEHRHCFSPREAMLTRLRELGQEALTNANDRYDTSSYVRAIRRGCEKAEVTPWRPHRLRHNAASRLVQQFGWDVARIILGHRTLSATRIYGEDDLRKAIDAMRQVG